MSFYYHSIWQTSGSCGGAPSSMFVFDSNDLSAPLTFQWLAYENGQTSVSYCGFAALQIVDNCCWSSYDTSIATGSLGYYSMMESQATDPSDAEFAHWTPRAAIGQSYCSLYFPGNSTTIQRFILNDGACQTDMSMSCSSNGTLTLYDGTNGCSGGLSEVYTSDLYGDAVSGILGNITVSFIQITNGSQDVKWVAYEPYDINVIYFNTPFRILCGIFIALGCLGSLSAAVFYLNKMRTSPNWANISYAIVQLLLFLGTIFLTISYAVPLADNQDLSVLIFELESVFRGLGTLALTLVNEQSVMRIRPSRYYDTILKKALIYLTTILIHASCIWMTYQRTAIGYVLWIGNWETYGTPIWFILSIVVNNACLGSIVLLFAIKSLKNASVKVKSSLGLFFQLGDVIKYSKGSLTLLIICFLDTLYFIVIIYLSFLSNGMGNDIDSLLSEVMAWLSFAVSGLLSILVVEIERRRRDPRKSVGKPSLTSWIRKRAPRDSVSKASNVVTSITTK